MKKFLKIFSIGIFLAGFSLIGYSVYNLVTDSLEMKKQLAAAKEFLKDDAEKSTITNNDTTDLESQINEVDIENISYDEGKTIGLLYIPKLKRELPIIQGVGHEELKAGVGHYTGTAYPLQNEQIVLSGHRETVFKDFAELELGDTFVVHLNYGIFEYEIYETDIVDADDLTVIRERGEEILTVTTCYPFNFIGNAPERAIFYAKPVENTLLTKNN